MIKTRTGEVRNNMRTFSLCTLVCGNINMYRGSGANPLVGPGLLSTYGAQHKKQRKMLDPVFSTGHMRNLTPLFNDVGPSKWLTVKATVRVVATKGLPARSQLRTAITSCVKDGRQDLDILGWMNRTAIELVG